MHEFRRNVLAVFKFLRSDGKRGIFIVNGNYITIISSEQLLGKPINDNKAKL